MSIFQLDGLRALVTGGSKGIGAGIARALAEAGADLVLLARGKEELDRAADELSGSGRRIHCETCDLSKVDEIAGFYADFTKEHGPVDVLVNNAGRTHRGPAHEMPLEKWRDVLELNLSAVFALSQAFAQERIAAKQPGKIINIGSLMSSTTRPDNAPYAASKGGLLLLTKALAVDWAPYEIRVNAIGPGYISTPLNKALQDDVEFDNWVRQRCPMGRWGTPQDLGGTAVFLASPASDFITGQIIYVDGGWLARF